MNNRTLIIFFLISSFCYLAYGSELLSEEAIGYYNDGVKAQKSGDFYNADINYQKSILLDVDCKKFVFNNYGVMYAEKEDMQRAETAFKEALAIDPDYNAVILNLSLLYLKISKISKDRGDVRKALDYLEKAFYNYPKKSFIIEEEIEIKRDNF